MFFLSNDVERFRVMWKGSEVTYLSKARGVGVVLSFKKEVDNKVMERQNEQKWAHL